MTKPLTPEQRQQALETFRKEMKIHSSWSDDDAELHLEWPTWLRSWQLATQAAYEHALVMAQKLYDEQGGLASGAIVSELRAISKGEPT